MAARVSGLGNALTFASFDLLTSLGSKMSVRSFKTIIGWGMVLALVVVGLGMLAVMRFVRALVFGEGGLPDPNIASLLAFGTVMVLLYLGASCFIREVLTRRRFCVSGNPNIGLFKALDVRMIDVFLVVGGIRIALFHLVLFIFALTFFSSFADLLQGSPFLLGLVFLVPAASMIVVLEVAARNALRPEGDGEAGSLARAALFVACAALGWTTSLFLGQITQDEILHFGLGHLEAGAGIVALTLGAAAIVCLVDFVRCLGRIRSASFSVQPQHPVYEPARGNGGGFAGRPGPVLFRALHREFRGSGAYSLFDRSRVLIGLALAWTAGVYLHGGTFPVAGVAAASLPPALFLGYYLLALAHVDAVLGICGPTALARQFRIAWENGRSAPGLVSEAQAFYNTPLVLLALGGVCINALLFGHLTVGYIVIGSSAVSAALISESLTSAPKELADGRAAPNLFVGLMTMLISMPSLAMAALADGALAYVGIIYCFVLWGGAALCMTNRMKTLPLMLSA